MSDAAIIAEGLTKRFGNVEALRGVDLQVRHGTVLGLLGPNGAGKTTTLRMLLGLIRPTSGDVTVLGRRPGDPAALAKIGSMIEGPAFYPYLSGHSNLAVVGRYAGVGTRAVQASLEAVDLGSRGGDKVSAYSLGMKQRLGVAAALLKDPDVVVLDEPTNGLDPGGIREMRALIRRLGDSGRTVILSSHMLGEVQQVCDRVGVIAAGRIVAENTVEELRGDSHLVLRATPSDVVMATLARLSVEALPTSEGAFEMRVDEHRTGEAIRALVLAGVDIHEVRRVDRQLEDVFFEVTDEEVSHV